MKIITNAPLKPINTPGLASVEQENGEQTAALIRLRHGVSCVCVFVTGLHCYSLLRSLSHAVPTLTSEWHSYYYIIFPSLIVHELSRVTHIVL